MQSDELRELASKVDDHEWHIEGLRRDLKEQIETTRDWREEDFRRRLFENLTGTSGPPVPPGNGAVTPRRAKRHSRLPKRLRPAGWLRRMSSDDPSRRQADELLRRNAEAFDRLTATTDRQAEAFDRQAEAFDRQAEAFDRQAEAFDRQAEAFDRQAEAFDRHERVLGEQTRAIVRQTDGLKAQIAELKHFGKTLDERTRALTDSFAFLAKDLRGANRGS